MSDSQIPLDPDNPMTLVRGGTPWPQGPAMREVFDAAMEHARSEHPGRARSAGCDRPRSPQGSAMTGIDSLAWLCSQCDMFTEITHQSTFCKITGESDVTVHWCCPGRCELAIRPPSGGSTPMRQVSETPDDELRWGATKLWFYEGAVLEAADDGAVSVADLLDFAQQAQKHYPDSRVQLHAYGLRVTKTAGTAGPRLEWRDWD